MTGWQPFEHIHAGCYEECLKPHTWVRNVLFNLDSKMTPLLSLYIQLFLSQATPIQKRIVRPPVYWKRTPTRQHFLVYLGKYILWDKTSLVSICIKISPSNGRCQMYTKALNYSFFFYWLQLVTSVFALGKMPKPPLSRFCYTVWKIYRLIFNDFLLMFNEEIQSALCKFHPLFHYRNISYVNVGSERKAAVWILIVRLACSTLLFPSLYPSLLPLL